MIGKNNKYLKDTRNGVKVESYSIKKFKVGAASVVIGASIFFGAGAVAQASEEVSNNTTADNTTNAGAKEDLPTAPVATTQPVAKETTKEDVAAAVAAKLSGETAKEVKALDKTKLENYIAEIEAKLANGTYESKTEESVAVLKEALKVAKDTLENATTQDEIKKAYNKLVTTANTKLKNKPVEKKETPVVDTTNGKETVGKKAENTEKNPESNSIENTGSNDPRNRQAIPTGIQFRAEVAVSEPGNKPQNNHYDTHILNDINGKTSPAEANRIVGRVTGYKVRYNKDENGKITSLDWLVYFNDHLENLDNTYGTDGGEVYRNYIQIPKEVNMPDTITRAQYASPRNPKFVPGRGFVRARPNGQPLSDTTSFDNPTPGSASDLPREGLDTFNLRDWPNGLRGRSVENLATQLPRYFKSAASDSSPTTRDILRAAAINEDRLIVDRSTTGGSSYNGYVWSFTTTVPNSTTNEQLQDMKVVFGLMRSATAGANGAFINVASNPVNMWQSDIYTPTAKDQTVKFGAKPDATKSIGNFNTLPQGTTVEYKNAVNTQTPGKQQAIAVVTYPDTSKKEVPVNVIVEKETVVAKPVIKTDLTGKAQTKTPVEVAADAGATVELFDNGGNSLGTGVANNQGVARITPTKDIPAGNVTAKATKDGKTSQVSEPKVATDTTAPAKPVVETDLTGKAGTKTPVVVAAEPGSTVKLLDKDGNEIGKAVAGANGKATITPTKDIPAGNVTAKATDAAGNTSDASEPKEATPAKDTTAPAKPVVTTDLTGKAGTKDPVEVTAEPGSKVELFDKDGNKVGEGVANDKGVATITPTKELPEGGVTAKATDPAGNVSEASEPKEATPAKDTTAPAKPNVGNDYVPSNGGGNNSGNGNGTSGNNAANNTDAKVDKAKLEGAIHQLDELSIKESAKLNAETAKEANALSADAKKVFANADATQAEVDAMVKRIEDFMAKVASSTDHATPATTQAAANASQTVSAQANARKAVKELPNTGTVDSTVAMVAAAASALLGLGLAGRRRKEDEEA